MSKFTNKFSISSRGIRPKLIVAFCLMSVIPILVCFNYIFPSWFQGFFLSKSNISITFLLASSVIFALLGFTIVKEMVDNILKISSDAKIIANGDFEHKISVKRQDEIGDLGKSLAELTGRIKDNMSELQTYSERTKEINLEINKRVLALSSLLHISNLISQGDDLNEVLEVIVEKVTQIGDANLGFLILFEESSKEYVLKSMHGPKSLRLKSMGLEQFRVVMGKNALGRLLAGRETLVLDSRQEVNADIEELQKHLMVVNALIVPVVVHDKSYGLIGIGNDNQNFTYSISDTELMSIFAKQTSIAVENDILLKKIDKLEIRDVLTGLFNESYIRSRLDEEIKRAINFQRPCSFVLLSLDDFGDYEQRYGKIAEESVLKKIATLIREGTSDIDKAARFSDSEFAVVLPEKNKRQSLNFAEEMRKKIELVFQGEPDNKKRLTLSGTVTENPIDGVSADELITKALETLKKNSPKGKNQIWS
ncbi:MAG TPA: diguanylate cyclase [Candidatus Omnitrophota bacterium]|nr:diguanylate cyclase [Candidatus Omnitrophota bacterium]